MGLHLIGKVSEKQFPFDNEYLFYFGLIEKGEEENFVSFRRGEVVLNRTMQLWDLINPQVRKDFNLLMKNEIETDENERESGGYLVSVEQIKIILELIDEVDERVEKFLDSENKVLPQYVEYVHQHFGLIVDESSQLSLTELSRAIGEAQIMKEFLKKAIEFNYPLTIG